MFRRTDGLLIGGLITGILVALTGLVDTGQSQLNDATAARVNGVAISTDELRSLLERRALEGAPVDQLQRTLDDMIDEELLIQRALELGLLRRDSNIRVAIMDAMEKSILSEAASRAISEGELEDFYRANTALFSEARQLQVDELILDNPDEALSLADRLRNGAQANDLATSAESVSLARLPPVPLSLDALARRYPQDVIARLQDADAGDVLVHKVDNTMRVIRVVDVLKASVPPFDEVRLSVLNELQMQRQDEAYDEYLDWLRLRADIRRNEGLEASSGTQAE